MRQLLSLSKNHRFRQFHRIPSSGEDGRKFDSVISGDMCLGNDPSHAGQGDFCASNRVLSCMQPLCQKRPLAFFDKLKDVSPEVTRPFFWFCEAGGFADV